MTDLAPPTPVTTRRETLNELLVGFLGSRDVHFQPDPNFKMQYPAIVYEMDAQYAAFADNAPWRRKDRYQITLIDRNPDVPVRRKVETLAECTFTRSFVANGLNHFVYSLYF